MENIEVLNYIADSINKNENLNPKNNEEMIGCIVDFCGDLLELKQNFPKINFNSLIKNLETLKFKSEEDVNQKFFASYNKNNNTITIYDLDRRENLEGEKKYYIYKSLLDCSITTRKNGKIHYGITNQNGDNITLNNALCENILSLLLKESRHNFFDIEMNLLYQIEGILGPDILMDSLFNSNHKKMEEAFSKYGVNNFLKISKPIDRIQAINFGKSKPSIGDEGIIAKVQNVLQEIYIQNYAEKGNPNLDVTNFRGNLITSTSPLITNKNLKYIFKGLPANTEKFDNEILGIKTVVFNNTTSSKTI